jgi:hypothetical protein
MGKGVVRPERGSIRTMGLDQTPKAILPFNIKKERKKRHIGGRLYMAFYCLPLFEIP